MDPQNLSLRGKVNALIALGRIPFATEVPLWTLFGCLTSSQIFGNSNPKGDGPFRYLDGWATIQCMLITWGTNISINYCNEYFDWDVDRPEMVADIKRDLEKRQDPTRSHVKEQDAKMLGSVSRIIHDGTFPPYISLLLGAFVQGLLILLIYVSRNYTMFDRSGSNDSPFRGLALQIGILSTILSQAYIAPPLRLHYHGFGELTSALLLSPVSFLFGLVGHYTASIHSVPFSDLFANANTTQSGFYADTQIWTLFASFYCFEQARILVMHLSDIEKDRAGGKNTFCVKAGRQITTRLYLILNGLCAVWTFVVFRQLRHGQGMVMNVAGDKQTLEKQLQVGTGGTTGAIIIGSYALPVVLITGKSLFASLVNKGGNGTDKTVLRLFPSAIPVISGSNCAMLVSMASLVTPLVLSLTLTATVYAVRG